MSTKTCWKCRSEMNELALVCPNCQAKVGARGADGLAKKPLGWAMKGLIGCGGMLALFIILGFAMASGSGGRKELEAKANAEASASAQKRQDKQLNGWKQVPAKDHLEAGAAFMKREEADRILSSKYLEESLKNENAKAPDVKFTTKQEWIDIRTRLGLISEGQPEFAQAQALLHRMDLFQKQGEADGAKWEAKLKIVSRKDYAKKLEQGFIEQRMNADVTATGKENQVLSIKYALASKVMAHDLTTSGLIGKAKTQGFRKVVLTDGYNFNWEWDLTKPD